MGRAARYLIAQHVQDLFRNEPRNIGVIVSIGNDLASRFLGEGTPGKIDGRSIKHLPYPDVYRQWVDYWNTSLTRGVSAIANLRDTNGKHYRIIEGGEVADIGEDSIQAVAQFLYSALIDEAGFAKALGGEEIEIASIQLQEDILAQFEILSILSNGNLLSAVKHPVIRNATIQGTAAKHNPTFYQQNGHPILMETIDLSASRKTAVRDHAGWAAFMFDDVRKADGNAEAIAIARITPETQDDKSVKYALDMLHGTATGVVNWFSDQERQAFLEQRLHVAMAV